MEFVGSCLILAIVGVMGSVFVEVVVLHRFRFSGFDFELFECVEGDEGGNVAAVQVSVTGQSSDLTRMVATPLEHEELGAGSLLKYAAVNLAVLPLLLEGPGAQLLFQD